MLQSLIPLARLVYLHSAGWRRGGTVQSVTKSAEEGSLQCIGSGGSKALDMLEELADRGLGRGRPERDAWRAEACNALEASEAVGLSETAVDAIEASSDLKQAIERATKSAEEGANEEEAERTEATALPQASRGRSRPRGDSILSTTSG